ncbi:MAG TPA: tripartite tricarboxylate transporter TctB family protein [Xanthobacteraceae bacterium]|nr:tripartite tricarboxylate transporter TctB family protein [Xanthobacteraceae bacterium]
MQSDQQHHVDYAGLAIGVGLLLLAAIIGFDTANLELSPTYGVGPKAMPIIVGSGLALLALANRVLAWRGGFPQRETFDAAALLLILGGLAALIGIIMLGGGFIPAIAVLFATTSAAFGRRAFITDLVIGLVLGFVVYLLFSKLLSLGLPTGPLERLM